MTVVIVILTATGFTTVFVVTFYIKHINRKAKPGKHRDPENRRKAHVIISKTQEIPIAPQDDYFTQLKSELRSQ